MKSTWSRLRGWFLVGDRLVWLQYSAFAMIILLPVLLPGYVLTLDMVFTPHLPWPAELTNTYPLDVLLWLFNQVLPGDVVQKIVLLAVIVLSGVGAHLLVKQLAPEKSTAAWQVAAYFAGVFYVVNPFIYARLMAGQWLVLLGYALLPFLVRALFRLLTKPTWRNTAVTALWAFLVIMLSIHMIGVVIVLASLFLIAAAVKYWRQKTRAAAVAWHIVLAGVVTLFLSSYWLVPTLLGFTAISETATRASEAEFSAFATHGGPLGPLGEVLRMQGFWVEMRQLFVLPQDIMPLWGLLLLLLWVLVIIGAIQAWKRNRLVTIIMAGAIIAGAALASTPLLQWLATIWPLFGGWREPHKFTTLVVLGYAVLGAYGVVWLTQKQRAKIWAMLCLALPLLIAPTMLWAGAGQLRTADYPREWYGLNTKLNSIVQPGEQVLFLPWHMYAPYSFSHGRIIANPATKFFEVPVIVSDDPEFAGIAPNQADTTTQIVTQLLKNPEDAAEKLTALDIRYVILAKEQSWREYQFLETWEKVHEDQKIILYEVER